MRKRTRLFFSSVSEIVGGNGIGVVTLSDAGGERAITIVCDSAMKYQLGLRNAEWRNRNKLLPEVLVTMLSNFALLSQFEMNIYDLIDGEYKVTLFDTDSLHICQIRLSDAALLTRICDIPLYIDNELFLRQSAPFNKEANRMAIPINTLSKEKLKEELQKAIAQEDYRLASIIKEEIGKRKDEQQETQDN